jgi:chromosome partitioning protein
MISAVISALRQVHTSALLSLFPVEHGVFPVERFPWSCARVRAPIVALTEGRVLARILSIVNQKGGVGKTTTAVNLSAALAIAEKSTLLVDADPQANSTRALGVPADNTRSSLYEVLCGDVPLDQALLPIDSLPHLSLLPSAQDLIGAEVELVDAEEREYRLKGLLDGIRDRFEFVLIDCPPSLGLLTLNALAASDGVLIPVQCEYLALEGISQLTETIGKVRESLNLHLAIAGIVMTMYDDRTNLARQVVDEVRGVFGDQVYRTVIPRNVRLGEAPSHGKPIFLYDIRSKGADAYFSLAKEFLEHEAQGFGQGAAESDSGSSPTHAA